MRYNIDRTFKLFRCIQTGFSSSSFMTDGVSVVLSRVPIHAPLFLSSVCRSCACLLACFPNMQMETCFYYKIAGETPQPGQEVPPQHQPAAANRPEQLSLSYQCSKLSLAKTRRKTNKNEETSGKSQPCCSPAAAPRGVGVGRVDH